jgi:hypothetical protein
VWSTGYNLFVNFCQEDEKKFPAGLDSTVAQLAFQKEGASRIEIGTLNRVCPPPRQTRSRELDNAKGSFENGLIGLVDWHEGGKG